MNKQEYYSDRSVNKCNRSYKYVHKLLREWKIANGLNCKCVVHHRDDTDEVREYNEAHYELWGCNLDGTFEYGRYVLFMTNAEHTSHHHTGKVYDEATCKLISDNHADVSGENNPMFGHVGRISGDKNPMANPETREKVSQALKGRKFSDETRRKMSEAKKGKNLSDETRRRMSESRKGPNHPNYGKHLSEETKRKIRETKRKRHEESLNVQSE